MQYQAARANANIVRKLMFRLLPVQVILAAVSSVNIIVSSFFASNYIGVDAMGAMGLYSPFSMLLTAISLTLVGGAVVLCGKYMGQNEREKTQNTFSLALLLAVAIAFIFVVLFTAMGGLDLTGIFTKDPAVRRLFNRYLLGQALGVVPLFLGNLLSAFLVLENRGRRTLVASLTYIAVNVILNFFFVKQLRMGTFGLALASSLGLWIFFAVQAQHFLSRKAYFRFSRKIQDWREGPEILKVGFAGAATNLYQTIRGFAVNALLGAFVGTVAISAFATADNFMRIFWSVPLGMNAVLRMCFAVSVGEEDRQSLADIMRVMFRRYLLLMGVICAGIILCAVPITKLFYQDTGAAVFSMTEHGFRLLPICMPLSTILLAFISYGQAIGRRNLAHLLALLDGVVCVVAYTALLVRSVGTESVYLANILNGVTTTIVIIAYAWIRRRRFPRRMEELMAIPDSLGAPDDERLDRTVGNLSQVVATAEEVQAFCERHGVESRRAHLAGLAFEEMANSVIENGFRKDKGKHGIDVRVIHKEGDVILRLRDDCQPFRSKEQFRQADEAERIKIIGLRTVTRMVKEVEYQCILGLNVVTLRI